MKINLKLKKPHPRDMFRVLDLEVAGYHYAEYELVDEAHGLAIVNELSTPACKAWISCKELEEMEAEAEEETEDLEPGGIVGDLGAPEDSVPATIEEAKEEPAKIETPEMIDETATLEEKPGDDEPKKDKKKK